MSGQPSREMLRARLLYDTTITLLKMACRKNNTTRRKDVCFIQFYTFYLIDLYIIIKQEMCLKKTNGV